MAVLPVGDAAKAPYRWREDPFIAWRAATYCALLGVAALAWWVTGLRTRGMGMTMDPAALVTFLVTWVVMMAAMMFPSVAPMVATFVSIQRGRRAKALPAPTGATGAFVLGYLAVWSTAGLMCFGALRLGHVLLGEATSWQGNGRWLTATVVAGAAVYELTPAKWACLRRCRGPIAFVLHYWRDGRAGALRMGAVHGLWCIGCCWGLMAALVALGMMNLGWMVVVALLITVEKLLHWRRISTGLVALVLVLLALAVALAPDRVPGLTV